VVVDGVIRLLVVLQPLPSLALLAIILPLWRFIMDDQLRNGHEHLLNPLWESDLLPLTEYASLLHYTGIGHDYECLIELISGPSVSADNGQRRIAQQRIEEVLFGLVLVQADASEQGQVLSGEGCGEQGRQIGLHLLL
jgi:ABC-type proline/glycine betaine transport system permease subunit